MQNLASLSRDAKDRGERVEGRHVLADAFRYYVELGKRALASATPLPARHVLDNLTNLMPQLADADRLSLSPAFADFAGAVRDSTAARR